MLTEHDAQVHRREEHVHDWRLGADCHHDSKELWRWWCIIETKSQEAKLNSKADHHNNKQAHAWIVIPETTSSKQTLLQLQYWQEM